MKKELTELVFILDKSGSMYDMVEDTIGGINNIIDRQKSEKGEALVSVVQFNNRSKIVIDRENLKNVRKLTREDYRPEGSTALLDCIGGTIEHIEKIHHYINQEDVPEKTLFVIMTDGLENASLNYNSKQVKKMIEDKKKAGWEFMFLAANIDAIETAKSYGIEEDNAVNFINDNTGARKVYLDTVEAISGFRAAGKINKAWKARSEADFGERNKKQ